MSLADQGKAHSVGQALESGFGEIVDEMRGWVWTGSPCAWHRPAGPNVREEAKAMQTWADASRAVLLQGARREMKGHDLSRAMSQSGWGSVSRRNHGLEEADECGFSNQCPNR
jgi:hypothetical protein